MTIKIKKILKIDKFPTSFVIFHQHRQYVYQMKAKNIPDKNLTQKNIICYEKFAKNWIFTIFAFSFEAILFFVTQIFQKIS